MVVLCTYITHNVNLLLHSGIGETYDPETGQGQVGRNYAYQSHVGRDGLLRRRVQREPLYRRGRARAWCIDEFNGDNFDHTGLGFIGGGYIAQWQTNGRPIESHPVPDGTPILALGWKQAVRDNYNHAVGVGAHGAVMSFRGNYLDLDPTYKRRLRPAAYADDLRLQAERDRHVALPDRARGRDRARHGRPRGEVSQR